MKHLYRAEDNAFVYYIVEDWTTGLAILVDWDLSDDEENDLIKSFENGTLDETKNGQEWHDIFGFYDNLFNKKMLY